MSLRIGIAITTLNRKAVILELIKLLKEKTVTEVEIVVCDDGSEDETKLALEAQGILVLGGERKGIAWNKNRGLYYLFNFWGADLVFLMDDDIFPLTQGWEKKWIEATLSYGHINFLPLVPPHFLVAGRQVEEKIVVSEVIGGAFLGITRQAFAQVGYMDSRFGFYGHEHVEYTNRFIRAGFGGVQALSNGVPSYLYYGLNSGLLLQEEGIETHCTEEDLAFNTEIYKSLHTEDISRWPWHSEETRKAFLKEFSQLGKESEELSRKRQLSYLFDAKFYLETYQDVLASGMPPLEHYIKYGSSEGRKPNAFS